MNWPTVLAKLPDAVPSLLGALVGGFIALFAAAWGQYLSHRFTRRREAEKLRREKAEELLQALSVQSDWVLAMYAALPLETSTLSLTPPDRTYALQRLYFPELREPIEELNAALMACLMLFRTQLRTQWSDYQTWRRQYDPALFGPLYQNYLQAWTKALDATVAVAASSSTSIRPMQRHSRQEKTP